MFGFVYGLFCVAFVCFTCVCEFVSCVFVCGLFVICFVCGYCRVHLGDFGVCDCCAFVFNWVFACAHYSSVLFACFCFHVYCLVCVNSVVLRFFMICTFIFYYF